MKTFINKKIGADDRYQLNSNADYEGGDLNANNLAALDDQHAINNEVSLVKSKVSDDTHIHGLPEFNKYGDLFQDLTKRNNINTFEMDVIEMIITYDSKLAITIVKKDELSFEF